MLTSFVGIYLDIVRFSFQRFFAYPLEIASGVIKRIVEITFLMIFWTIYINSSGLPISINQTLAYFLIAMGVGDIVMSKWGNFSREIRNQVKSGELNNNIVKPVNLLFMLYSKSLGNSGIKIIFSFIYIIIGIAISDFTNLANIGIFLIFMIIAWSVSFAYNILEGSVAFHTTESSNISNVIQNSIAIVTGSLIPLSFFPDHIKNIIKYTPFPSMVYLPASSLSFSFSSGEAIENIIIGIFWAVILNFLAIKFWRYSIKKYEAIGI